MGLFDAAFLAFGALMIVIMALQIAAVFWIWMVFECLTKEKTGANKTRWAAVTFFGFLIGAAFYYLERRPRRIRELGA